MIYSATCFAIATLFASLAWRTATHAIPWNDAVLGASFAYGTTAVILTSCGIGEIMRMIEWRIKRQRAEQACGTRLPAYQVDENPQPTL